VRQCEESLRRLQADYIDIYCLHNWDPTTPVEETLRGLDDLVRADKIRYVGLSDLPAWVVSQAQMISLFRGYTPVAAMQIEYSLLERTVEGELIPAAVHYGIGVTSWGPLRSGHLTGKYRRDAGPTGGRSYLVPSPTRAEWDVIDVLREVAEDTGVSMADAALAWMRTRPALCRDHEVCRWRRADRRGTGRRERVRLAEAGFSDPITACIACRPCPDPARPAWDGR
jgi:aryl-alcohol dehydrogenase-like predicted oxidoreductase